MPTFGPVVRFMPPSSSRRVEGLRPLTRSLTGAEVVTTAGELRLLDVDDDTAAAALDGLYSLVSQREARLADLERV